MTKKFPRAVAYALGCGLVFASTLLMGCDGSPTQRDSDAQVVDDDGSTNPMFDVLAPDRGEIQCIPPAVQENCANGTCTLPSGCFTMGAKPDDPCLLRSEVQNEVVLTRGFTIPQTEVTQQAFLTTMGYSPSFFADCTDCPVENVSWHEAVSYCNALSEAERLTNCYTCQGVGIDVICKPAEAFKFFIYECAGYRLPTEAEWEYAARGGTETSCYGGDILECQLTDSTLDAIAWYQQNSDDTTHPVGTKPPNAWGLYDMAGNVGEWIHDWWSVLEDADQLVDPTGSVDGESKVVRGGSYAQRPLAHRAMSRLQEASIYKSKELGFRCVRSLP